MNATITRTNCFCPDDCNCHYAWRTNYCGCKAHTGQPTVVGMVDRLGYLRCITCNDGRAGVEVMSDSAPHNAESCDSCGSELTRVQA